MKETSLTLKEIAQMTGARLQGSPDHVITNVADLESATSQDVSFFSNARYEQALKRSNAGAIFVSSENLPEGKNYLFVEDPSLAFQTLINHFYDKNASKSGFENIHPTAVVHPTVKIGKNVVISPYAVVDQNVTIGDGTQIGPHVSIGPSTQIGENCIIYAHVTIREKCTLGNRVILQPGCIIGSCGFGYITNKQGEHIKLEQVGTVTLEDDVEIGANTTIDRSRFKSTVIGKGTKIDNLVQIAHGVKVGQGNMIVSQAGIAGSSETGRFVVIGGQVGIAGHIKIADGVMIAAKSGITKSLPPGTYNGVPAVPIMKYNRNAVFLQNIEKYLEKINAIEKRIDELLSK